LASKWFTEYLNSVLDQKNDYPQIYTLSKIHNNYQGLFSMKVIYGEDQVMFSIYRNVYQDKVICLELVQVVLVYCILIMMYIGQYIVIFTQTLDLISSYDRPQISNLSKKPYQEIIKFCYRIVNTIQVDLKVTHLFWCLLKVLTEKIINDLVNWNNWT